MNASVLPMVRCPTMSGHRPLLLAKCQKPRRELARNVTIEAYEIDDPLAKESREQQRRVIGRFSEPFRLLDQRPHLSHGRLGFGRAISFDMHERVQERDLQNDLLAPQVGRAGQGRDLRQGLAKLSGGFDQRRAFLRPQSRLAPQAR